MSTAARVGLFALGLAAVFAAAFGVGRVADPDVAAVAEHENGGHEETGGHEQSGGHEDVHLSLTARSLAPGKAVPVSFQVRDADGHAVTDYDVEHEKELHLIALDTRALTDFQHAHPTREADGTWTVRLDLQPGTSYRLYADGSTSGTGFLATADLVTTGTAAPSREVPGPAQRDRVDGFAVDLEKSGDIATLRVTRDGRPAELEPYLGALGHLVVIRVDDLSYLHVHPEEGASPEFAVSGLGPGRYRYFFDFQVDGVVRTAAFTVEVGEGMPMGTEERDHDD